MAVETSGRDDAQGGTCGLEVELNVLDRDFKPVQRVGFGPESVPFADHFLEQRLPAWVRGRFQLEVFNWMAEATTHPYFSPYGAVAEARLLEAVAANALAETELAVGEPLFALHGNIPYPLEVSPRSIPDGWNLARKRYLARCVELFGASLATAGIHTNHSFPEALLSWDFIHLPETERRGLTLEGYRNDVVIRATRLMRPYCPLFIAVSAASPLAAETVDGTPQIVLTGVDSQRMLTFPNPSSLDIPNLYAGHREYLRLSYELVRSGKRFGANNWTPVRARSGVEPVMRNILATSEQLRELYRRGLYANGEAAALEEAERAVMVEKLCARVDLPMSRVEVRTDEGGDSLELAVAKVAFKQLLMLYHYADSEAGAGYVYGNGDVERARRNEEAAAREGLDAEIEHPFGEGPVVVREWLGSVLESLEPLAEALGWYPELEPLREMAGGGVNPAGGLRQWLSERVETNQCAPSGTPVVPREALAEWARERRQRLGGEVAGIVERMRRDPEWDKLAQLVEGVQHQGQEQPAAPVRLQDERARSIGVGTSGRTGEVLALAAELVRIPSVTNCSEERLDEVSRCGRFIAGWLREAGLVSRLYDGGRYPAVLAAFPGAPQALVTLCGHFDVVRPEPDDRQLEPLVEGDYLVGRGAADMKTVVASYMVWMRHLARAGGPPPPINLLLVGNEENGEAEPFGTPHVLDDLRRRDSWEPGLMVVGERTGENGDELVGKVCTASRGVARMRLTAHGRRGHTGVGSAPGDLLEVLVAARQALTSLFRRRLTLSSLDGWQTGARFPFLNVGETGVYNITPGSGVLGVEIRPIPEDDLEALMVDVKAVCTELKLDLETEVMEPGVACPADNPWLSTLLDAVEVATGSAPVIGRKLPGSSARFAPRGNAVVWGQTGLGPHSADERHFIPSIEPYLRVLDVFAARLAERDSRR
ncbi:MAG: M20/M25/M40 family metallo-hydrolase [Acidobacteria bacterium]|nr:M20/M25/M40 family metallo-hydrolase [Acidobacteriota bacterium]